MTKQTPPSFLIHAKDDKTVNVNYSTSFYNKLRAEGVPTEIHLYEQGGRGFGLNNKMSRGQWTDWLHNWMKPYLEK